MTIFNRKLLNIRKQRLVKNFDKINFFYHEIESDVKERLLAIQKNFPHCLILGQASEEFLKFLREEKNVVHIIQLDSVLPNNSSDVKLLEDIEELSLQDKQFDLIISNLELHHINNIPVFLHKVKSLLPKDGVCIFTLFGADTLAKLKEALVQTEAILSFAHQPHFIPFIHIKDLGMIFKQAGFDYVISDSEIVEIEYENESDALKQLLLDLRNLAQNNITINIDRFYMGRQFEHLLENTLNLHQNGQHKFMAQFEILTVTALK